MLAGQRERYDLWLGWYVGDGDFGGVHEPDMRRGHVSGRLRSK